MNGHQTSQMKIPNQLIHEKSPYLIQHAFNPVNWHPWGDHAFSVARSEDKPVFLSVGYATCHWCHVMEKESFENSQAAELLNDTFVCIKVDREERPDIDAVYMAACHLVAGKGGWPLTMLLTPDKQPFFAATYLPLHSRLGQSGVLDLCRQIKTLWTSRRSAVTDAVEEIDRHLKNSFIYPSSEILDRAPMDSAYAELARRYDPEFGGFKPAPKFPSPHRLLFLLQQFRRSGDARALEMVETTLSAMRHGGIWDHVGFGFHRYATDKQWLLPHFEKMLYDQAMLLSAYLEAYRLTSQQLYARTAEEIIAYVFREMTSESGAFFTAEDADSEGEEGRFYVWTLPEFRDTLKSCQPYWESILDLKQEGNFRDESSGRLSLTNILHIGLPLSQWSSRLNLPESELMEQWDAMRQKLFEVRSQRVHPLKDDKILTDWNGLMISALSAASMVLHRPEYAHAAVRAAEFVLTRLSDSSGNLFHRYRDGQAAVSAFADDYAFMVYGLLALHAATDTPGWLHEAVRLQTILNEKFLDREHGGFFMTENNSELPVRPKELYDGAMPSANSVTLVNLYTLYRLTSNISWLNQTTQQAKSFMGAVSAQPSAFTFFLAGLDLLLS